MKVIASIFLSILLLLSCTVTSFAQEYDSVNNSAEINVSAKYSYYTNDNIYTAEDNNGLYSLELGNGLKVYVNSPNQKSAILVVHLINENDTEAYKWFIDNLDSESGKIFPFDIYFRDVSGNRIELDKSAEIKITFAETSKKYKAVTLSSNGKLDDLKFTLNNNNITFKAVPHNYYIVIENVIDSDIGTTSPPTGDNSNIKLYVCLLIVSMLGIVLVSKRKKQCK